MNTPRPCDDCEYLYYDCMCKDDPDCLVECKLGLELGDDQCPAYEKWVDRRSADEQSRTTD